MEEELISKKELLDFAQISYGQLYRWKRKNLIPEEWFIRKSTFTGQETFFPKEKILARIDKIKNMKDDLSLDELADVFSPNPNSFILTKDDLIHRNIVSKESLQLYTQLHGDPGHFPFNQVLFVYILNQMLTAGEINLDEGKALIQVLHDYYPAFQGKDCELIFTRNMGVPTFVLVSLPNEIYFDKRARMIKRISLGTYIEEMKMKLNEWGK